LTKSGGRREERKKEKERTRGLEGKTTRKKVPSPSSLPLRRYGKIQNTEHNLKSKWKREGEGRGRRRGEGREGEGRGGGEGEGAHFGSLLPSSLPEH